MPGKIIFLHGASSSGKSSIARAVQASIEEPFWHYSIDHLRDGGVIPLDRFRSRDFQWSAHRAAFFDGFHRSLQAFAGAGNNLLVEHIIDQPEWMAELAERLRGFDVFFVGVFCPLDELERREAARGDRPLGDARRDFETIHRYAAYDLCLDALQAPDANARHLIDAWSARSASGRFFDQKSWL